MNGEDDNTSIWGRNAKGRRRAVVRRVSDDDTAWPRRRSLHNGGASRRT
ncbi:hypothetical protein SUDANB96_04168 [Streptomyces sp. enrichment culture]